MTAIRRRLALLALLVLLGPAAALAAAELPTLVLSIPPGGSIAEDAGSLDLSFTLSNYLAGDGSDRVLRIFATVTPDDVTPEPPIEVVEVLRAPGSASGTVRLATRQDRWGGCLLIVNLVTTDLQVGGGLLLLSVVAVNDAPLLSINRPLAVGVGGGMAYSGADLQLSDADQPAADQLFYTLATAPLHGELRLAGTLLAPGDTVTQAAVDAGSLVYRDLAGVAGTDTWTFTWRDGAGSGPQGPGTAVVEVGGAAVPLVLAPADGGTWREGDAPLRFATTATVEDGDSSTLAGGFLAASVTGGANGGDALGIQDGGSGAGSIDLAGATVRFGGVPIGTLSLGGTALAPQLSVAFSGTACTPAAVQALLRSLTFRNTGRDPLAHARTATVVVNDGDAGSSPPALIAIAVQPVNDAPLIDRFTAATPAGLARTFVVVASDPDNPVLTWSLATPPAHGAATLVATSGRTATVRYVPEDGFVGDDAIAITAADGAASDTATCSVLVCGPADRRLLPLVDPPREAFPGDLVSLTIPWQLSDRGDTSAGIAAALGPGAPAWASVAVDAGSATAILTGVVPADQPTGVHVRFQIIAGMLGSRGAGVLPLSVLIRPRPAGSG